MNPRLALAIALVPALLCGSAISQEDAAAKRPEQTLQSIGPLAFAPNTLLISDPASARIWAIETGDVGGVGFAAEATIEDIGGKLAAALGTTARELQIVDLAVHESGQVFVALTRGRGPTATPVVAQVSKGGEIGLFELGDRKTTSVALPNPPEAGTGRNADRHLESITDLAYVDGKVVIAGLSNEEFASKLRVVDFPFSDADPGASVEIFHGAHGKLETRSPVRTFTSLMIDGDPHLLAAYTCTPLVQIKLSDLAPGKKVRGKTIAELGNRNRPLDMIVYEKGGASFLLIANSSRGVMKVPTTSLDDAEEIVDRVVRGMTAGVPYETITDLQGVEQLDKLGDAHAVILVKNEDGRYDLRVIALP